VTEQKSGSTPTDRQRAVEVMNGPFLQFDLAAQVAGMRRETDWQEGHNAKTIVKYPDFRVVLIALKAGGHLKEHKTGGRISIHAVSGRIRVHAAGQVFDLPPGQLLVLDRDVPHDVEALEESAFLLTIAWPV
jgi:quercetin dioxygenase-like cupin family protein